MFASTFAFVLLFASSTLAFLAHGPLPSTATSLLRLKMIAKKGNSDHVDDLQKAIVQQSAKFANDIKTKVGDEAKSAQAKLASAIEDAKLIAKQKSNELQTKATEEAAHFKTKLTAELKLKEKELVHGLEHAADIAKEQAIKTSKELETKGKEKLRDTLGEVDKKLR